jgi:hypothetical protein
LFWNYRVSLTPEQRKDEAARVLAYRERRSEDEIISGRLTDSARKAASREQASEEERNSRRLTESARIAASRANQEQERHAELLDINSEDDESGIPDLAKYVETDEAMKRALEYLLQTKVGTSEQYYQASVCVICDELAYLNANLFLIPLVYW